MNLSLVAHEKIDKDPRKLAFLFPKMPLSRFRERVDEFYRLKTIKAAEDTARACGAVLLPSTCLHHRRRDVDRRIVLYGRTYYIVDQDSLTPLELEKYRLACEVDPS